MDQVVVSQQPLDSASILAGLLAADNCSGAVTSFCGKMRDFNLGDRVQGMYLEHYPGMTERALQGIISEARRHWTLNDVLLHHRVGQLQPGEQIVLVAVSAEHRDEAFRACEFIIDYLKTRAPFWKKEQTGDGDRWLEERAADRAAFRRWQVPD